MMYCFREREQLLNLNEMLAGFRMFPSYIRIGGLREDLPRGFHEAVREFLDKFPGKLDEYEKLLTKNQVWIKRTQGRRHAVARRHDGDGARRADRARRRHPLRRAQDVPVPQVRDVRLRRCRRATDGDVFARYHGEDGGDARRASDLPAGARAHLADRRLRLRRLPLSCRRRRIASTPRWKR